MVSNMSDYAKVQIRPAVSPDFEFEDHSSYFPSLRPVNRFRRPNAGKPSFPIWKRLADVVISSALLIFFAPLFLVIAALVRLDGGPALYSCKRPGYRYKTFKMYKFRSMKVGSDAILERYLEENPAERFEYETRFKLRRDPRVTRVGQFLRTYSLDELPQLINVFKGEMSLVGPRPRGFGELELASQFDSTQFNAYFRTKPGMTGLWQVSGRSDTDYETRVRLDASYVRSMSLARDFALLLLTIPAMITGRGAY